MGGGGSSPDAVDQIPEWAQPYYKRFLEESESGFLEGATDPFRDPDSIKAREDALAFTDSMKELQAYQKNNFLATAKTAMGLDEPTDTSGITDAIDLNTEKALARQYAQQASASGALQVGGGRTILDNMNLEREGAAAKAQIIFDAKEADKNRRDAAREVLGNRLKDYFDSGALPYDMAAEASDAIGGQAYETLMRYRDLIDATQPRQTAVQGGGK
jgi:hypothetical protein